MAHTPIEPATAILERIRDEFRHDPETGELFRRVGTETTSKLGYTRLVVGLDGKATSITHIIWFLEHGTWPKTMIDHADGDSMNNRPDNLREVLHSQNLANSKHRTRSLPTGVHKKRNRFQARITAGSGRTQVTLGTFDTPEEAEKAFIAAHLKRFGEHSRYHNGPRKQRF